MTVVERDYPDIYKRSRDRPLMDKLGNGGKGINWNTEHEVTSSASSTAGDRARRQPGPPAHATSTPRERSTPAR
jgi:nitrate reductase alpha subunit